MKARPLGRSGARVAAVGQGTWELELGDEAAVTRALWAGLEAGMTHVDTAEMYGAGRVEELLGRALRGRRQQVFLASKVLPTNASRQGTRVACEASLRRLGTDHLDLYLLHWPGPHPLEDTLAAFEALRTAGKIRHYGVSNFDAARLEEAVRLAGPGRIVCNQVLYHLEQRAVEQRLLEACGRLGVTLVAYSPLAQGRWSARGARVLADLAAARHAAGAPASPAQLALAFLLADERVVVIPRAARAEHALENAAAADLQLGPGERRALERAFPPGPEPRELPTL